MLKWSEGGETVTLGVNNNGQKWYEALATFLIVLLINVLLILPDRIPTYPELYMALKQGILTAFILYAINKGIEWRLKK